MDSDTTYSDLYRETAPSVVSVYPTDRKRGRRGAGSGFVYDDLGHVVTNEHVVSDSREVELRFSEGDWRTGRVVGSDAYTDLAVIAFDDVPEYAPPLPVASESPDPGERVAAFGNPIGLDGTMTTGVVSGTNRSTLGEGGFTIPDTVQTDAAINPGNSGGPLVTVDGRVVGVNRATSGENIGFAVSPRILNRVVPGLIEGGSYAHSYLRIRTIDVSPSVAEANDLAEPGGVLVLEVGDGPARDVLIPSRGSRRVRGREVPVGGDVIVGIDGTPIDSHEELTRYLVTETSPGDAVEVSLHRDGVDRTERIELLERPEPGERSRRRRLSAGD